MGISIKNDDVEALIRKMSEKTGKPITDSVGLAVREWLVAHGHYERAAEEARQSAIDEIISRARRWPVYDNRDHGDILYDRDGLPK
jgi:hypothetical protein